MKHTGQLYNVVDVDLADMSVGEDLRWLSEDSVVWGTKNTPAAVRTGSERAACDSAVHGERGRGAGQCPHHPSLGIIIKDALSRRAEEILRRLVREPNIISVDVRWVLKLKSKLDRSHRSVPDLLDDRDQFCSHEKEQADKNDRRRLHRLETSHAPRPVRTKERK